MNQMMLGNQARQLTPTMQLIPAIDLRGGRCVQLEGGDFGNERISISDVKSILRGFEAAGASCMNIIDLDAAKGIGNNAALILDLLQLASVPVAVGGGIRTIATAQKFLKGGAAHVIVGTAALTDKRFLPVLAATIGPERIIVALDYNNGKVVTHGWETRTTQDPLLTARKLKQYCCAFLMTCVEKEGLLAGPDIDYLGQVTKKVRFPIIAAGGITTSDDIIALRDAGVRGAVLGMALYTRSQTLENAMRTVRTID